MYFMTVKKEKILIVDDSEMNRSILMDILETDYDILEAENGEQAIKMLEKYNIDISLVLLDIVMPVMDGFEVLAVMNQYHWIDDVPVVMISAANSSKFIEKAYDSGVTDFISRPFDPAIVYRRVQNTIMLYSKQRKLVGMIADQIYEKEKRNNLMVAILSHIVEFRNGESGLHVLHVQTITELLLSALNRKSDKYHLSKAEISLISVSSALHDIGKIAIDEKILNKPGRLTDEEFKIMKTHSEIGFSMLEELPFYQNEELVKIAKEICRWHHERYDGRGYPDGLKGDEIPISAQVVSIADVYDALTSERVYKKAFSHEKAMDMIINGECGSFNPLLLECLKDLGTGIKDELSVTAMNLNTDKEIKSIADEIHQHSELSASERTLELLEYERKKYDFFATMSQEIQFEYTNSPAMLIISERGARKLGLDESILDPMHNETLIRCLGKEGLEKVAKILKQTTIEKTDVEFELKVRINGVEKWQKVVIRTLWDDSSSLTRFFGKLSDLEQKQAEFSKLEKLTKYDELTGLYNRLTVKEEIKEKVKTNENARYTIAIFDIDDFDAINEKYGHAFGDEVLKKIADVLSKNVNLSDTIARIGGDEFLIFYEDKADYPEYIDDVFKALLIEHENVNISISMGISNRDHKENFTKLAGNAYIALSKAKSDGKKCYRTYDESMD